MQFIKLLVAEQANFSAARESANNALREGLEKVSSVLVNTEEESSNFSPLDMTSAGNSDNEDDIDQANGIFSLIDYFSRSALKKKFLSSFSVSSRNVPTTGGVNRNYGYIEKDVENISENNKIAILYALLTASVVDFSDSESQTQKRGYDARFRVSMRLIADWLNVPWQTVVRKPFRITVFNEHSETSLLSRLPWSIC